MKDLEKQISESRDDFREFNFEAKTAQKIITCSSKY